MHISEGVLSAPVLMAGATVAAAGVAIGLRRLTPARIPEAAVMASAFFVASLIRIPAGPVSAHLTLNGLMGVALGWAAFPAILVALGLQALLFQYGGFTTLGVNTCVMAAPAVIAYYAARPLIIIKRPKLAGFVAGVIGVGAGSALIALALISSGDSLRGIAQAGLLAQAPALAVEAVVSAFLTGFLYKVKPEIIGGAG